MKFITSNEHKFREISEIMAREGIELEWIRLEYDEIQEDFTELISYRSCLDLASKLEDDFFLEDTGLYIRALSGFPGPYSAYVKDTIDCPGIIRLLSGQEDRGAYFKTVISLSHKGEVVQFGGILNGTISNQETGSHGFGYDPIFIPEGGVKTLAELDVQEKNEVSHRGRAISAFVDYLKKNNIP